MAHVLILKVLKNSHRPTNTSQKRPMDPTSAGIRKNIQHKKNLEIQIF